MIDEDVLARLVDAAEISRRLFVSKATVHTWTHRQDRFWFPNPVNAPGLHVIVWDWHEVEVWALATRRLRGDQIEEARERVRARNVTIHEGRGRR